MARLAEKIPSWASRFLIPEIERIVDKRMEYLEKVLNARFDAVDEKIKAVHSKLESLEKRFDVVQDMAMLKAEVKELREKMTTIKP
jgi:hypothetical protein